GASATGCRPIIDLMFMDIVGECMDEVANQMAKMRFMFGGKATLPVTVLTMGGAGGSLAAQHSQSLEAWLAHLPGMKVVMPSDAYDAKGMIIAAFAIGSHKAYVYIRGEYFRSAKRLQRAIDEAYTQGWLGKNIQATGFDLDVVIHRGAGAYICGEETALLTSLEGGKGFPRLKPPFPAISGLFQCPTIVNNVETLACVPFILRNGAEHFAGIGTERQGGTRLFCVCGHVARPGVYEEPVSITLRELIEKAGGVRDGNKLKAVIPGGISAKILSADEIDVAMDFDSLKAAGTMAGSGGVIVMDETTSIVQALDSASRFFADESCGQCSPCREGTGWMMRVMDRLVRGDAEPEEIDMLLDVTKQVEGHTICALGDAAAWPIQGLIRHFRDEIEDRIKHKRTGRVSAVAAE
ncbi:NADH-quinone oxidoreductase subunit NuoF, partial [uncultured Sulfitobacter sp.]|uniref:NADH-quinone oxidoreductase subunit NuoF n=1 Tax=uncultured Sulfitobacter sp. TaxID=191468 RepID=UPI0025927155